MIYDKEKHKSAEYSPTPSHTLPAFVGGKPTGYVCQYCGHMEIDEDEVFGKTCKKCFRAWCEGNISQMSSIKEIVSQEQTNTVALEKTTIEKKKSEEISKTNRQKMQSDTTKIMLEKIEDPTEAPPEQKKQATKRKSWFTNLFDRE